MPTRFAIAGFRHGHIHALCQHVEAHPDCEIVAACEEDAETRAALAAAGKTAITHTDIDQMLAEVDCDVVAVGDCYGKRGNIAIRALKRGRHVIADKPICTRLSELDEIQNLLAASKLHMGCMLDLRNSGIFIAMRQLLQDGAIGEVQAVNFGGQHPLSFGSRPMWYFEPDMHGGTINDIAIHALDLIPWLTGSPFASVTAARTWNAFVPDYPHFRDGAQFMMTLANGAGVMGDVSYFMPSRAKFALPQYWRMTVFGSDGIIESRYGAESVWLAKAGADAAVEVPPAEGMPGGYLQDFLAEVSGQTTPDQITTASVLHAARVSLLTQQAGDQGGRDVAL